MSAQQFATGSVHSFVRFAGGSILYLGTCESMPQDQRNPEYEMLMNDISGSKVPLDVAWEGESAQISLVLTRWDENVANVCETPPGVAPVAGSWFMRDVGTLMSLEKETTELWLVYTFGSVLANKVAYTANGLHAGRHYPQCVLWSPQLDETGTKPMKRHFMYYAWPRYDPSNFKFTLYDYDFTGITSNLLS